MKKTKIPDTLEELNIKYLKLMSGESIISYIHDLDIDTYGSTVGLEEPMVVNIDGDNQYTFTPWFPFTTDKIHLLDSYNIIAESPVDTHMKAYYMKLVLDDIIGDEDVGSNVLH